jgi:hypothetical protein
VRHGIPAIALWRHKIEEAGLASCVRNVKDAGLHVSSVCRGGMFPSPTAAGRQKNLEDSFPAFAAHEVGLVLDVFHIWWDPQVLPMIAQCRGRIYGFHVNDWLVPLPDLLLGRE